MATPFAVPLAAGVAAVLGGATAVAVGRALAAGGAGLGGAAVGRAGRGEVSSVAAALRSARRESTSSWLTPSSEGPLSRWASGRVSPISLADSGLSDSTPQISIIEFT